LNLFAGINNTGGGLVTAAVCLREDHCSL
jgi:hypothetical protein